MNPLKTGTIAAFAAAIMLVTELAWRPIFTVHITSDIVIPLWILAAIYAGLQFYVWRATRRGMQLSDKEVARWGEQLERVTPQILEQVRAGVSVKEIAATLEASEKIPDHVTLRYIIALGSYTSRDTP